MLLIPFIENAFKHGSLIDGFLQIEIDIHVSDNQLNFTIRNTVLNQELPSNKSGIGLENIRKRLDINYKESYSLNIETKDNWYFVNLIINDLNKSKNG
jgi:sensor histidine kinase YesM